MNLYHKGTSVRELDPRTKADIVTTCARLFITGIKATTWEHHVNANKPFYRFPPLQKAAFFTTVAAQSML